MECTMPHAAFRIDVVSDIDMPLPWKPLPPKITERRAAILVAEALAWPRFAAQLAHCDDTSPLDQQERGTFLAMKMSRPESGSPGIDLVGTLVDARKLGTWVPPAIPYDVVRSARPADQAGALVGPNGSRLHEPRGSIYGWCGALVGLALRRPTWPARRSGGGRAGKPSALDLRGILRILLRQVERCRPGRCVITAPSCVALLLWLDGHCRPAPPPPPDMPGKKDPLDLGLPIAQEIEPSVTSGGSVRKIAKAILNRARARQGEYVELARPSRGGSGARPG
jgi:hypothetical protein